jgi:ferredoxin
VGVDQTLLDAADAARVQLPRSCRNGTCRTCICRVVSGTVVHTIAWPGLLPEEKSAGYILPCVAQPMSNVVLDHPTAIAL